MGYSIKAITLLFVLSLQVAGDAVVPLEVMGLLLLAAIFIFREKYLNRPAILLAESLLILVLALSSPVYLFLYSVTAYDLSTFGLYPYLSLFLPIGIIFLSGERLAGFFIILALCASSGYLSRLLSQKEASFQQIYDRERQIRYDLEEAKGRLLNATREAAHLAEIRERNRIAREIHDSIGHNLAGILLQLQVANKTLDRDEAKARDLLAKSITGLASSVDLLRDTVHNIKPRELIGLNYIEKVIANFQFCTVTFKNSGDFSTLTAGHIEIISSILKEALTNASRHSQASVVEILLDIHEQIVRLYIKDNGRGCDQIREGLGLSGMRERVHNIGGTITINANDGFMIVCVLPKESGGGVLESANRR
jgi:signal transduction histidine kinase